MNGVYWHFGDYYKDTQGLSPRQHGIYRLLLDWYYMHEKPLPDRLPFARMNIRSRSDRAETYNLLAAYFDKRDDGWHHKRADKVIGIHQDTAPARAQKKADNSARQRRFALIRKIYVQALRKAGCEVSARQAIRGLAQLADRIGIHEAIKKEVANAVSALDMETGLPNVHNALAALTANALNTVPDTVSTTTNSVSANGAAHAADAADAARGAAAACVSFAKKERETAHAVADAARFAGLFANHRDALLLHCIAKGATLADFEVAIAQAQLSRKGWAYMLGIVRNRLAEGTIGPGMAQEGPKSGQEGPQIGWREALLVANAKAAQIDAGAVEQKEG